MNEITVNVSALPGTVEFNLEGLKNRLKNELSIYEDLIVTEESVKANKKDLAMLRKVRKELNDKKIEVKNTFMEPYTAFENEVKEALALIDKPIGNIDKQIKEFETKDRLAKKEHCEELLKESAGELLQFMPFNRVFNEKWLNKTTTDSDIKEEISVFAIRVRNDIDAIKALGSGIEVKLLDKYKQTGLLADAIHMNTDYLDAKMAAEQTVESAKMVASDNAVEVPMNGDKAVFTIHGAENIEKVRQFLDFSDIEYEVM